MNTKANVISAIHTSSKEYKSRKGRVLTDEAVNRELQIQRHLFSRLESLNGKNGFRSLTIYRILSKC
jgi:hypothetical protein